MKFFHDFSIEAALLSLLLALATFIVATLLTGVKNTRLFTYRVRSLISDYAMSASGKKRRDRKKKKQARTRGIKKKKKNKQEEE